MKRIFSTIVVLISSILLGTCVLASTGTVQTNSLNVREKPSTDSNSIGVLEKGDQISIISEENEWYKIKSEKGNGYVKGEYIVIEDGSETPNINEENVLADDDYGSVTSDSYDGCEPTNEIENNSNAKLTDSEKNVENTIATKSLENSKKLETDVDLYILPLVNANKIGILEEGTEISIISNNGKWLFVQSDNNRGWIISKKIDTIDSKADQNEDEKIEENEVNEENTTLEDKTSKDSTENKVDESMSTDEDNGKYPITMYVSGDSVNIRKSPSTSAEAISGATKNDTIKVIGKEGDWYKVDTEDGVGYIKSDLLSSSKN